MAEGESPTCPVCKSGAAMPLADSPTVHRYQCPKGGCGEIFVVPKREGDELNTLSLSTEPGNPEEADLRCPKCQKPYLRGGKIRQKHVDVCKGTTGQPARANAARPRGGGEPDKSVNPSYAVKLRTEARGLRLRVVSLQGEIERVNTQAEILEDAARKLDGALPA